MRWFSWIGGGLLTVLVLVGFSGWFLVNRSVPDYDGTFRVTGLSAPVEVVRTANAIPHIIGTSDADVFLGLGYAHAQDRFWQMEMLRRTAQGRLSALVGPATVEVDELLRRLDLYGAAETSLDDQSDYTRAALDAYAAGVNARLEEADGWGELAPEFLLFPMEIEPWRPVDSIALMKILALQLASHIDREVLRARVSRVVSPARLKDILPDDPNKGIVALNAPDPALPGYAQMFPGLPPEAADDGFDVTLILDEVLPSSFASNAWAAGPSRSESGAPILANDTHLNFSAPSVWYLARLELQSGAVIGGTIPGIPTVLSGRSADLAWGLTAANMDDQDVFIEKLNPDNSGEVLTPGGFKPLRTRQATIEIRGGEPVELELRWSENGPVLPGKYYNLSKVTPPGHVAAIGRTLLDPADTSMSAAHRLLAAKSIEEAIVAVQHFVTPAQNLTMVDRDHIALQMIGKMPRRVEGHTTLGRMPSEGWIETNRWHGTLPYSDNPRFVDPVDGVVGNTNSKTVDRPFPVHVSFDWGDTQRIQYLEEALQSRDKHSRESFMALQYDAVSLPAQRLLPLVTTLVDPTEGRRAEALALLKGWDGSMDEARPEPLIYATWMRALQAQFDADELGDIADAFTHPNPIFLERVLLDTDGAAIWCDDVRTAAPESCADAVGAALDTALDRIVERHDTDLAALRWGDVHQATHDHPVLGKLPVIGRFVNIRQSTSGGDNTLLRGLTRGTGDEPLQNLHGALYRAVIDMADPDGSVFVISTGESGHPLSPHYRDLGQLWRTGDYAPMRLDLAEVRKSAIAVSRLVPK